MIGMDSAGAAAAAASGFAKAKRYDQSANVDDEDLDDDGGKLFIFQKTLTKYRLVMTSGGCLDVGEACQQ